MAGFLHGARVSTLIVSSDDSQWARRKFHYCHSLLFFFAANPLKDENHAVYASRSCKFQSRLWSEFSPPLFSSGRTSTDNKASPTAHSKEGSLQPTKVHLKVSVNYVVLVFSYYLLHYHGGHQPALTTMINYPEFGCYSIAICGTLTCSNSWNSNGILIKSFYTVTLYFCILRNRYVTKFRAR